MEDVLADDRAEVPLRPGAVVDGVDEKARVDQPVDDTGLRRETAVAVAAVRGRAVEVPDPVVPVQLLPDGGVRGREV